MLFNSFSFAVFLPIVFIIYWAVPKKYQWVVILTSSYYFYMSWNIKYVFLILFTTIVSYAAARLIEKEKRDHIRKFYMTTAVVASLGVLFFFKYFNFVSGSIADFLKLFSIEYSPFMLQVLLPVGISFYTFQTLSYVIDVYRGRVQAEKHFGIYAAFISFFPQLVAGPIERTTNLLPQIKRNNYFDYEQASYGMKLMAWGFFKKIVLADTLAIYVDAIYGNVYNYQGMALVLATFFFAVQIYCDFSGYSDIAIGCAKLFGINLMSNFKSPYFSSSVKEFWGRWHISLSTWFRDYVYIPLGGSRVGAWRHKVNLLITFLVSGLWHGANWTYVIWGGVHGIAQILENVLHFDAKSNKRIYNIVRMCIVFAFVTFAWVFFRAQSIQDAFFVIGHSLIGIGSPLQYMKNGYAALGMGKALFKTCMCFILMLGIYDGFSKKYDLIAVIGRLNVIVRWLLYIGIVLIILFYAPIGNDSSFIYFQF